MTTEGEGKMELVQRTCKGVTKAGRPCRSPAVGADGFCFVHGSPSSVVAVARKGGLRSGETRREQAKSVRDRLREKVEEEFEKVWAAFLEGLEAETPDGAKDVRARLTAAQALLDQACGRPAQAIGGTDTPLEIVYRTAALLEPASSPEDGDA